MPYIIIFVTVKNTSQAKKIAQGLLQDRLIACANIIPNVQSNFIWQGKMDQSKEAMLVLKSKKSLFPRICSTVKALHSYKVPEIIALPIITGSKDYLSWIGESVC